MTAIDNLRLLTKQLPYNMREAVDGYASSVYAAGEEIFRNASISYDEQLLDKLVFFAGVRRIWTLVDTQYWIIDNSLSQLGKVE